MAGEIKHGFNKVSDAIGGTAGKISASTTTTADSFVENATIGNLYELEAAKTVLRRARSEPVRLFARKMLLDHTTAKHQMSAALEMNETNGVAAPPQSLDTRRETMLKHLAAAPESDFDASYIDQQVLAHEETVSLMHSYAEKGDNPQLRSLAQGTLPVVERHLRHVKMMKAEAA
ncbi:MAG: DUF4142 domain-containing protein [Sphingomonadaceae bacterium]